MSDKKNASKYIGELIMIKLKAMEGKIAELENTVRDIGLSNTAKILNQNKIVADYAELKEQIAVLGGEKDLMGRMYAARFESSPIIRERVEVSQRDASINSKPTELLCPNCGVVVKEHYNRELHGGDEEFFFECENCGEIDPSEFIHKILELHLIPKKKPTEPNACDEYGNPIRTLISGSVEPIGVKEYCDFMESLNEKPTEPKCISCIYNVPAPINDCMKHGESGAKIGEKVRCTSFTENQDHLDYYEPNYGDADDEQILTPLMIKLLKTQQQRDIAEFLNDLDNLLGLEGSFIYKKWKERLK